MAPPKARDDRACAEGEGLNLKGLLTAMRRFWVTFVLVTVAVFAIGLALILLSSSKFVSSTQLMVSIEGSTTATAYQNEDVAAERVNSYIPLLRSGVVTQRVIDKLGLPLTTSELADKISATRVPPRTPIIDISVTDDSPQRAQLIANTLASEFVSYTDALETPTGEDSQKVHTTVISDAGEARGNYPERILLAVVAAFAALLAGAVAVWIRARVDSPVRTALQAAPVEAPAREYVPAALTSSRDDLLRVYRQVAARLRSMTFRTGERSDRGSGLMPAFASGKAKAASVAAELAHVLRPDAIIARVRTRALDWRPTRPDATQDDAGAAPMKTRADEPAAADPAPTSGVHPVAGATADRQPAPAGHRNGATLVGVKAIKVAKAIDQKPAEIRERKPWLLAFLCFLIPALPSFVVLAGPLKSNGSPARMIAVLFLGLGVLGFFVVRRTASHRTLNVGVVIVLVYFLLQLTVYGVSLSHLDIALVEASKNRVMIMIVAYTGIALYALTRVNTPRQRTIALGCLAVGLTFACLVGILQQADIDLRYLFQPPGFVINVDYLEFYERQGVKRAWGTSIHPLEFSVLAAVTVPLTIHFVRFGGSRQVRLFAALACGVALLALPTSVSRSGIVALSVALLLYIWNFRVRTIISTLFCAGAAIAVYIAAFPRIAHALWQTIIHSEQDESVLARTADYAVVGDTFRAHPIFGMGLGSSLPEVYGYLDNEWLQALVQGGLFGFTAMVVIALGGLFGISAALRAASTPRERDQAYALGAVFVGIMSSSFTMDLFSCQQASLILFMTFALLWANFKPKLPEFNIPPPVHTPVSGKPPAAGRVRQHRASLRYVSRIGTKSGAIGSPTSIADREESPGASEQLARSGRHGVHSR